MKIKYGLRAFGFAGLLATMAGCAALDSCSELTGAAHAQCQADRKDRIAAAQAAQEERSGGGESSGSRESLGESRDRSAEKSEGETQSGNNNGVSDSGSDVGFGAISG